MSSCFLRISLLINLLFYCSCQLRNSIIAVLDDLFLSHKEKIGFKDVHEETEVGQRLADAIVGQFGTSLEHLVNTTGVSEWVGEEEATGEKNDALFVLLQDLRAEGYDVGD